MADIISANENLFFWILAFLSGSVGAWFVSRFANTLGFIDSPTERSSHVLPTAKGGGIGILCAFVLGFIFFQRSFVLCLSVTFLSLLSLVGDRIHLSPRVRLASQFVAAFTIIFCLPDSSISPLWQFRAPDYNYGLVLYLTVSILIAIFIVGTANFYNFMDGINGLAAITGVVGFGLLASYGVHYGKEYNYSMLCVGLGMACLGFLPFNIPKAKVFMGDVGSILLGFVFAVIVTIFAETVTEFIVLACFLFPFYADELLTMLERIRRRQSLARPHRCHLYQVLANEAGFAHWKVSLGYGVLQLVVGVCVWQASCFGPVPALVVVVIFCSLLAVVNWLVKRKFTGPRTIWRES